MASPLFVRRGSARPILSESRDLTSHLVAVRHAACYWYTYTAPSNFIQVACEYPQFDTLPWGSCWLSVNEVQRGKSCNAFKWEFGSCCGCWIIMAFGGLNRFVIKRISHCSGFIFAFKHDGRRSRKYSRLVSHWTT